MVSAGAILGNGVVEQLYRQYRALNRILTALGTDGDDLPEILDAIARACAEALEADSAHITLPDNGAGLPTAAGLPVRGAGEDDASLHLPLLHNGTTLGLLHLERRDVARPFTAGEIEFARQVADQSAIAIDRARRDAEARRRAERAEALREIGRELTAELDFGRFLITAREQVARLVDYESCWLALWDEATDELDCRLYIAEGVHRPDMERRLPRGQGLAWALINERRTMNVPDYLGECARRGLQATGYGTAPRTTTNPWLGVPLLSGGRIVGAMAVQRRQQPFSAEEAATLELLAGQIAAALENARLYAEARQLASADPLTGLANHRHLHDCLDAELARADERGWPVTAIMADLDNFKLFNDTYGHPVGDQVLRLVAEALRAEARGGDILGRYGGDEFLVILPGLDATAALDYIDRVGRRMAHLHPALGEGLTIPLALSAGVATYPQDAGTRHDLIALADSALYTSKRGGVRNVVSTGSHAGTADLTAHTSFGVVEGLVLAVDAKDHYTAAHSLLVADIATLLARARGLSEREEAILRTAGMLHDVGKISIPDRILRKPAPLSKEEWTIMRQHVEFSELIIRGVPGLHEILEPVMHHHERWDGRGYPRGLAGEAVPLLGRIMIIADAYSAMTLDRPYRSGLSPEQAIEQLRAGAGTHFDPELTGLLCDLIRRGEAAALGLAP